MSEQWIVIPKWEEFQHYNDRDPVWIKNYTRLLRNPDYLALSGHTRSVLHGIWLVYASSNGQLPLDARSLHAQLNLRVSSSQLESLIHAGFIQVSASRPLALRYPREEKRREETDIPPNPRRAGDVENGTPRQRGTNPRAQGTNPRAATEAAHVARHELMVAAARLRSVNWPNRTDLMHDYLDELEREHGGVFTDQERTDIIDEALSREAVPF